MYLGLTLFDRIIFGDKYRGIININIFDPRRFNYTVFRVARALKKLDKTLTRKSQLVLNFNSFS